MSGSRWGVEGPPSEAYSRVSNTQRFEALHAVGEGLLTELERRFEVDRVEAYGLDPDLERDGIVRPTVRLIPRNEGGAPITVSFTAFPGIRVRAGNWFVRGFPFCGCDACDETLEGETSHLEQIMEDVVAGRFREAIRFTSDGAWLEHAYWDSDATRSSGGSLLGREDAESMVAGIADAAPAWKPWKAKGGTA